MTRPHTPGPWSIDPRVSTRVVAANDRGICSTAGYFTNTEDGSKLEAENLANARLIAAAPALLSALEAQDEADKVKMEIRRIQFRADFALPHNVVECSRLEDIYDRLAYKARALRTSALADARADADSYKQAAWDNFYALQEVDAWLLETPTGLLTPHEGGWKAVADNIIASIEAYAESKAAALRVALEGALPELEKAEAIAQKHADSAWECEPETKRLHQDEADRLRNIINEGENALARTA